MAKRTWQPSNSQAECTDTWRGLGHPLLLPREGIRERPRRLLANEVRRAGDAGARCRLDFVFMGWSGERREDGWWALRREQREGAPGGRRVRGAEDARGWDAVVGRRHLDRGSEEKEAPLAWEVGRGGPAEAVLCGGDVEGRRHGLGVDGRRSRGAVAMTGAYRLRACLHGPAAGIFGRGGISGAKGEETTEGLAERMD